MDQTYYKYGDALLPDKYTISGVSLRSFCLGHLILLDTLQNPIVSADISSWDIESGFLFLCHALLVCALSYEENVELLEDEVRYKKVVGEFEQNLLRNMKENPEWTIFKSFRKFKEYMTYFMAMPFYTEENTSNELPSGSDWKQNMVLIFKKLGYPESEILNMNMKKLFYLWISHGESEGAIKVLNKFEIEQLNNLKKG